MSEIFRFAQDREAGNAAKVRALEALLIEKGVIGRDSVDTVLHHFETVAGAVQRREDRVRRHGTGDEASEGVGQ